MLLQNNFLACAKVKQNRGLSPQTPAAAQSEALGVTPFAHYPASIAIWKTQDRRAPTQVLPPGPPYYMYHF